MIIVKHFTILWSISISEFKIKLRKKILPMIFFIQRELCYVILPGLYKWYI